MDKIKWRPTSSKVRQGDVKPMSHEVERFKTRWVVQGVNMRKGIDYKESHSYTINADSDRIMVCVGTWHGWYIFTQDFKNFYLQGRLADHPEEPDIFVEQAPGFEEPGKENWVCKCNCLMRALYSRRQQKLRVLFIELV